MTNMKQNEQTVYISCADEVRYSFVSHLSDALHREGISVFVDSDDLLSKEAQEKVESARVCVMVLPGNRKVCLEKLTKVLNWQRNINQVVPVLYGDSKWHDQWLKELHLCGFSTVYQSRKECNDSKLVEEIADSEPVEEIVDSELVEEIVRDVNEKLSHMGRIGIHSKLLEIENMVNKQPLGIRCVGIWGMPGIGKTILAKAFFDQVSGEFDACCFVEDFDKAISEKRIYRVLVEQLKLGNGGKLSLRRDELISKRVLVVLDDVRNPLVAESFLEEFEWFGPESLIIITSRDKRVFRLCQVNHIYEVQGLNEKEALQLFLLCASTKDMEDQNLHKLSPKVINYATGNPLAISIYGDELKGKQKLSEMETAFLKLRRRPPLKIVDAFKSSYDTLSDSEKNIFLDIACFFQGENVDYVKQLFEGCGFFPHVGIDVLVEKCLVTISENRVWMHNLTQDFGREIVNGETVLIERRNRLWEPWSIKYLLEDKEQKTYGEPTTTFRRAQGTEEIKCMFLDTLNLSFDVKTAAFENMLSLRLLKIYCSSPGVRPLINFRKGFLFSLPNELRLLHWENYPLQSLPRSFDPVHLVEINMPHSQLQKLWDGTKNLEMLRTIRLCHSQQLVDIGDLSKAQNIEVIDLQGCTKLQSFPGTGQLLQLRVVNLSGCREIQSFSEFPPNIEKLHLQGTGIKELPLSFVKPNGEELVSLLAEFQGLSDALKFELFTNLVKSSSSSQDLGKLISLELKDCSRLQSLPNMVSLEFVKVLDLSGCSELQTVQGLPRNLKELYLAGTAVREVPQLPQSLELLDAHGCASLKLICLDSEKLPMHCTFTNCFNLSPQVVNDILVKALANVKHMPREHQLGQELNKAFAFSFCAPSHANNYSSVDLQPGSSVMTHLTSSWRNMLVGFFMLVEVAFSENYYDVNGFGISCVCRWKNREGHSRTIESNLHCWSEGQNVQKSHMFVFYDAKMRPSTGEGIDPDILGNLVVFEFIPVNQEMKRLDDSCTVTRCGIYAINANTELKMSSSSDPMECSGDQVEEALRVSDDGLEEMDKALFRLDLRKLICLELKDCSRLQSVPNMVSLEFVKVLDLSGCSKLETIQGLPRNLKELYLAGTAVREVPQLPQSLELLDAHGCASLKSICLDSEKLPMHCTFTNCFNLSPQVVNDILVKALANVKHMQGDHQQELNKDLAFSFCAPSHANKYSPLDLQPGSSVMRRVTSSWRSTLVGFAMIVEVAFPKDCYDATGFGISCICRWKSKEGHSHRVEQFFHCCAPGEALGKLQKDHIFVSCDVKMRPIISEGNDSDILADLVVFEFFPVNKNRKRLDDGCTVTRCGVYMVTATATNTSLTMSSHVASMNPMDFSGNEVREVLRFRYGCLRERDKALFLYIACLFNDDDDADLVAPLIASINLGASSRLEILAYRSLIHISSKGEIMMHCVLRKFGKEILHRRSKKPGSSKEFSQDIEKVSLASSSSLSLKWKYDVFPSFYGPDVHKTFLSHFLVALKRKLINVFKDTEIESGQEMGHSVLQAIRGSRISIVVFSTSYASSAWQLNELAEIMRCREQLGQTVLTIFYDVDPSEVRKHTGDFGYIFENLCHDKTEDEKQQWRLALKSISSIAGYHSPNWGSEADMIDRVTHDVSAILNITTSKDFGDFVDIEDHISKMYSLLCLDSEEVRIVGIWGPLGIGKSTIARALEKRIARHFQQSIFVDKAFADKIFENYEGVNLVDDGTKLQLQTQFVSEILGHTNVEVQHLGMVRETLKDQKVLIILDDVRDLVLLEALVGQTKWFGLGSRIIVITEDKKLLYTHGIDHVYQVDFPSEKQALQIFCRSSFRQNSPPNDFLELAAEAVKLAGNLPLDLNVLGSSLRWKTREEWMNILPRLRYSLAGGIEKTLGIRREGITENDGVLRSLSPFPMASFSSHNWRYDVYLSFCGQDVRISFLSHFLMELERKSIIRFPEEMSVRPSPVPVQAIRESRISIVVISRNYASSSRLLNELVEITKCKEEFSKKMMPIFYDVDPSDVGKQRGDFGREFNKTCVGKTEDEKQRWRQALIHIGNLSGFNAQKWNNEADMIEKIVNDVTLNCTTSIDFRDLVGIEAHTEAMIQLLRLESEEVKMVGIWGPPGIGKTTVARALFTHLSSKFQRSAFIVVPNEFKITNLDDYGTKLHFQTLLLSKILSQKDRRIDHLGMMEERLKDQKVFVILDDVDDQRLLDALVGQTRWFGSGSRIVVITKDKGLLKSFYGIDEIYQVDLPSKKEAFQMFCRFAFGKINAPDDFSVLAAVIAETVGNLPLALKILGSSLRGQDKTEWMAILHLIRNTKYGEIEKITRVAYDRLNEHDKVIFLHIACFFNYDTVEYVTRLLVDRDLNVVAGLTSLAKKSFIYITEHGKVTMYQVQQDLGKEIVCMESSNEPGGRRFLVDSVDICNVLVNNTGTENVLGILLDMSGIDELLISVRGFEGMINLLYLRFYTNLEKKEVKVYLPRGLDFLSHKLKLLHWEAFPMRCMPINFIPEHLVELVMEASKLEELWRGIQPLGSLKYMSLRDSLDLRDIPDLSYATNLEKIDLGGCTSLTALPSSIRNLHELRDLDMEGCLKLAVLPTDINLESLYCLNLKGCSQLRSFPDISKNISDLYLDGTAIEEVPCWIDSISRLSHLSMYGCNKLKKISPNISKLKLLMEVDFSACKALTEDSWQNHPQATSTSLIRVDISGNSFERLPDTWTSIQPKDLVISNCRNLVSLPELPAFLSMLTANNCESLESLYGSFHSSQTALQFINCFKLNTQARELILRSDCSYAILPGGEIPAYFTHRAAGSSLTVSFPQKSLSKVPNFKACIMVESRSGGFYFGVLWPSSNGSDKTYFSCLTNTPSTRNHLIVFNCNFPPDNVKHSPAELNYSTVKFEFFCLSQTKKVVKIKECGIQLLEVSSSVSVVSGQISETEYGVDSGEDNAEETRNSKRIRIA